MTCQGTDWLLIVDESVVKQDAMIVRLGKVENDPERLEQTGYKDGVEEAADEGKVAKKMSVALGFTILDELYVIENDEIDIERDRWETRVVALGY
jgi:hypothetical protein